MIRTRTAHLQSADAGIHPTRRAALGIQQALGRLNVLAVFPLLVLTATWFGFDNLAVVTAYSLSGLLAFGVLWGRTTPVSAPDAPVAPGGRLALVAMLDRIVKSKDRDTAFLLLQIDDWTATVDLWGHDSSEDVATRVEERLRNALRNGDLLVRLGDAKFGVALGPVPSARLALRDTVATRLAEAVAEPIALHGATLRLSASIGHTALIRRGLDPADATFKAAEAALSDAALHAPGAIRAFAPGMGRSRSLNASLSAEVEGAIHGGAITAWFQPQICARTGVLTGMETLARWEHPKQGLLSPKEFFAAVEASGNMPLLGQTLIHQALKALGEWDTAKARVPGVSLNLSPQELRDPRLPKGLHDEIARFGLTPDRVTIEITESVASKAEDDSVLATLTALRDAGHPMDLDNFGQGSAAFATLRRFNITRVKIEHSLILGIDADPANRKTVAAIVAMADALGIETLAKGVETPQEMETLAEIGCTHLQGFRIARPMVGERVADWARARGAEGKAIRLDDRRNG